MKAYKVELLIIDHDGVGEDGEEGIVFHIENARYPNRCLSPHVMAVTEREIGPWTDGHPLNHHDTQLAEYVRLFTQPQQE